jgi:hypothetical protein
MSNDAMENSNKGGNVSPLWIWLHMGCELAVAVLVTQVVFVLLVSILMALLRLLHPG